MRKADKAALANELMQHAVETEQSLTTAWMEGHFCTKSAGQRQERITMSLDVT